MVVLRVVYRDLCRVHNTITCTFMHHWVPLGSRMQRDVATWEQAGVVLPQLVLQGQC